MKKDSFQQVLNTLEKLHKDHPKYSFGNIISLSLEGDSFGMSNEDVLSSLKKYQGELELSNDNIASSEYLDELYKDIENFDNILDKEEDDYE